MSASPAGSGRGRAEGHRAHETLQLRDADAEVADRLRVVQEAYFDLVEVARRPQPVRQAQLGGVGEQQRQLLLHALHQAAEGTCKEAKVLHSLLETLMLGHV
jgi:hypothetical protein